MDALSDHDWRTLEFAAEHRLVLATHVAALLRVWPPAAEAQVQSLLDRGLLRDARRSEQALGCEQITRAGLNAVGSTLPAPRPSAAGTYQHDVGLAWLWLAARAGAFGPLTAIVSERQMRSEDGRAEQRQNLLGVRLGGVGPGGRDRLHYPDLVLHTAPGHRVALELELTPKPSARLEKILAGYAADRDVDAIVYLVDKPARGLAITKSAARLGISHLVHVQRVSFAARRPADRVRAAERARGAAGTVHRNPRSDAVGVAGAVRGAGAARGAGAVRGAGAARGAGAVRGAGAGDAERSR